VERSESVTYFLQTLNGSALSNLQNGTVVFHIQPNGNDTWKFGFFVNMLLADGSHLAGGIQSTSMSEDFRDKTFALSQFAHVSAASGSATLAYGQVSFHTNNDNKDWDTWWQVFVRDENGLVVASTYNNDGDTYDDN